MVIFDATGLLLLLNEKTSPPKDPTTGQPLADAHKRIEKAVEDAARRGDTVLIPAPVFAELLVRAENAATGYIDAFNHSEHFKPVPFDQKAAIEHAEYTRKAIEDGDKRVGLNESICKIKFDRQIVAIAKAEGATIIYTDDNGLANHAQQQGLRVIRTHEITLSEQPDLFEENGKLGVDSGTQDAKPDSQIIQTAESVQPEKLKGDGVVETQSPPLMPDPSIG